jgi:hypothetical protein
MTYSEIIWRTTREDYYRTHMFKTNSCKNEAFMNALYNPFTELMNHPHKSLVEHLPQTANSYSTIIENLLLLTVKVHHYISIPLCHNVYQFNPECVHNIQAQYFAPSFFALRSKIICIRIRNNVLYAQAYLVFHSKTFPTQFNLFYISTLIIKNYKIMYILLKFVSDFMNSGMTKNQYVALIYWL